MKKLYWIFIVLGVLVTSSLAAITPGLLGHYFNDVNLTELVASRVDTIIDFTGPDTFLVAPADSLLLHGTALDTNGTIVYSKWDQLTGPNQVTLVNPDDLACLAFGFSVGYYTFQLTVTDNDGDSDADTVGVTVVPAAGEPVIDGELKKWHRLTITFDGPPTSETATPNPFTDYRFNVTFFSPNGKRYLVPGFFAADGNAAETSAFSGRKWRVHFTPDEIGTWKYTASFRRGEKIAVSLDSLAGEPASFDGTTDSFQIEKTDKIGRDFRGKGILKYVGKHHLQFAETGEYFLKGGVDSPENFLAYFEFDGTWDNGGSNTAPLVDGLHQYASHVNDWQEGDPVWQENKGKGIIGAVNYLTSEAVNSIYFLTMNVLGDGDDVWPWTAPFDFHRFDCSKLDQWEIVFNHTGQTGIQLHVITQETENDQLLNDGELGFERQLYYRELIARFAHHLAVVWNLGEETSNTTTQIKAYATYIKNLDPYDHPIVVHNDPQRDGYEPVFGPLLGFENFDGPSLQMFVPQQGNERLVEHWQLVHPVTLEWRRRSAAAGHPWFVCGDEMGGWSHGLETDTRDPEHDAPRKYGLWGNLMAGGAGVEWFFASASGSGTTDQTNEDFRNRQNMYVQTRLAHNFFQKYLPFWEMQPADSLIADSAGYCLAKAKEIYAIFLPDGGAGELELGDDTQTYWVNWYDPRNGGKLQQSSVKQVQGPGKISLGNPPNNPTQDWAVLVSTQKPATVESSSFDLNPKAFTNVRKMVLIR